MSAFDEQPIDATVLGHVGSQLAALPPEAQATVSEIRIEVDTETGFRVTVVSFPHGRRQSTLFNIPQSSKQVAP